MFRVLVVMGLMVWTLCMTGPAQADDESPRADDRHVSLYGFGLLPATSDLRVDRVEVTDASVSRAAGAGLKADWFPAFGGGILGFEAEVFGHGGKVSAPAGATTATGNLTNFNGMVNVLARYPGETLQPYVGAGLGFSVSRFGSATLSTSNGATTVTGDAADTAFAYQAFVGTRAYVTARVYLFGEYKFFGSNYHYRSNAATQPLTTLEFQTHLFAGGVGMAF
jgi:hypothetical protein